MINRIEYVRSASTLRRLAESDNKDLAMRARQVLSDNELFVKYVSKRVELNNKKLQKLEKAETEKKSLVNVIVRILKRFCMID